MSERDDDDAASVASAEALAEAMAGIDPDAEVGAIPPRVWLAFFQAARRTGCFSVESLGRQGAVYLRDGQPVGAAVDDAGSALRGAQALLEIESWRRLDGFAFRPDEAPPEDARLPSAEG